MTKLSKLIQYVNVICCLLLYVFMLVWDTQHVLHGDVFTIEQQNLFYQLCVKSLLMLLVGNIDINKLILKYLKIRHCKYLYLNIMYIKFHKLLWIRSSQKFDPHKVNNYTVQYKFLDNKKTQTYLITAQPS